MAYLQIQQQLDASNYTKAAKLLAIAADQEQHVPVTHFQLLLHRFPVELFDINPDLILTQALLAIAADQLEQATPLLQRASFFYHQEKKLNSTIDCYCRLISLYQRQEDFRTAYAYVQEVNGFLSQVTDQAAQAKLTLRLAELCPDIGRLREGLLYAQQALTYFRFSDQAIEHFQALLLLALIERQLGDYAMASAHLEMARQLHKAAALGLRAQAALLNAEAHVAWYRGQFAEATTKAAAYERLVKRQMFGKQQIYAATLLGNLWRAKGDYEKAMAAYAQARSLNERYQFVRYQPWIDAHESWCYLLRGDCTEAYDLLQKALAQADHGQMMSFNVSLAIYHLLAGRYYIAQDLLQASLGFYQKSGDELAIKIIQWYLAFIDIKVGNAAQAHTLLKPIFAWMMEQNIAYFPLWWHPTLMGEVCIWAISAGIGPVIVERICINHIGAEAIEGLKGQQKSVNAVVRERVTNLLITLQDELATDLSYIRDRRVKQVLEELLAHGCLQRQRFTQLQTKLTTANHQQRPNPVLIAVFGLYLHHYPQPVIAAKLGRAQTSIRNYITTIYQIFELPQHEFPSPGERKRRLTSLAIQNGFIAPHGGDS